MACTELNKAGVKAIHVRLEEADMYATCVGQDQAGMNTEHVGLDKADIKPHVQDKMRLAGTPCMQDLTRLT